MKSSVILILVLILCSSILMFGGELTNKIIISTKPVSLSAGDPPIEIAGDVEFNTTAFANGWSGNGTEINPYIIEYQVIDKAFGQGPCINISDTRAYFIIRYCDLRYATYYLNGAGVYLTNVTNGQIVQNTIFYNEYGIYMSSCQDIVVFNNSMSSIDRAGLSLFSSSSLTIENNTMDAGIEFWWSHSNILVNNTLAVDGFDFVGYYTGDFTQSFVDDNTVSGKPIIFWQHQIGGTVPTDAGQVILLNCSEYTVRDQIIDSSKNGIDIIRCTEITVTNNTLTGCYRGIRLCYSQSIEVFENNCTANSRWGIYLDSTSDSEIQYNLCQNHFSSGLGVGIYATTSENITISENNCTTNDVGIETYSNTQKCKIFDNICNENSRGISMQMSRLNEVFENEVVWNTQYGVVIYSPSDDNMIMNNNLSENPRGVYLSNCPQNHIINNSISASHVSGSYGVYVSGGSEGHVIFDNKIQFVNCAIYLKDSLYNTLSYNNLTQNNLSIYLISSNHTTIAHNLLDGGDDIGLYMESNTCDNEMTWNVFNDCDINAIDDGSDSLFDYNYWSNYTGIDADSDGIGDTPHPIQGIADNSDAHPVVVLPETPVWMNGPEDQVLEFGESFHYDLNATVSTVIGGWSLSDMTDFTINSEGVITNITSLSVGIYPLYVDVFDIYGMTLTGFFILEVEDTTSPSWVSVPENQILDYDESFSYQLEAFDLSGIHTWYLNNTSEFSINNSGLITNNTMLAPGVYHLYVEASDVYGNLVSATFDVIVQESTTTTTATSTSTTTSTSTHSTTPTQPPFLLDPTLLMVLGIGAAAFVIVIVLVLRKRA
ncbi:MAG: NosD domain-containing protein [Candidatus Thorarchaeota archaeon]